MDARDDLALVAGLFGLTAWETDVLSSSGWTVTLVDCDSTVLDAVLWKIQQREEEFAVSRDAMAELVRRSATRAATLDAKRGAQDLLDAHVAHQGEMRRRTFREMLQADAQSKIELVGTAKSKSVIVG